MKKKMSKLNARVHDFSMFKGNHIPRSKIHIPHKTIRAFNVGEIIPIYQTPVYPGEHIKMDLTSLYRPSTFIVPPMDDLIVDTYAFAVPWRIVWKDLEKFFGENSDSWDVKNAPPVPDIVAPSGGWDYGTLADHFGITPKVPGIRVKSLRFRAYAKIINDWFRDQNLSSECALTLDSSNSQGSNGSNQVTDIQLGGKPYIANKYHDYFTSCLPAPQKGAPTTLNVGGMAPVTTKFRDVPNLSGTPLIFRDNKGRTIKTGQLGIGPVDAGFLVAQNTAQAANGERAIPSNLWADLSNATGISISDLRLAITYQHYKEMDARGGTRYVEFTLNHFGVHTADARLQRSEFLGGHSQSLLVQSVPQTSSTVEKMTPQGNLAAFSETMIQNNYLVNKTFTEHSYIIVLAVVRYKHTYQQGIEADWFRGQDKFDMYDPLLANISEQPVKNREIMVQGNSQDNEIFGFQEAWADLRFKPNSVAGVMRSSHPQSLDYWHFADHYAQLPKLSSEWLKEDYKNVDRTLALKASDNTPQLRVDFMFNTIAEKPMPLYSTPGLRRI
ncbi:capsid protein [Spiroplasma phage 4]|uniref:Capsid protein VP1 n=1 Tax=Spiroplasma virus 4 TaxID=2928746 RepID=CAPSD_SPV4|nr:major head protein [Spiroplasma phage 4]P11333.1 RecName: Full=Capsid protein VP1; AltName: Full=VP1 [Spiroplasma phage 4]AAA72621.1 capsid protein [Spiroplasma phage 4]